MASNGLQARSYSPSLRRTKALGLGESERLQLLRLNTRVKPICWCPSG